MSVTISGRTTALPGMSARSSIASFDKDQHNRTRTVGDKSTFPAEQGTKPNLRNLPCSEGDFPFAGINAISTWYRGSV